MLQFCMFKYRLKTGQDNSNVERSFCRQFLLELPRCLYTNVRVVKILRNCWVVIKLLIW